MNRSERATELFRAFYVMQKSDVNAETNMCKSLKRRDMMFLDGIMHLNKGDIVKMSEISEFFKITPAAISQIIRNFENKGFIERIQLESDRRSVYIKVTPLAKEAIKNTEIELNAMFENFVDYLGEEDSEHFIRILKKCAEYHKNKLYKDVEPTTNRKE
ncbi:MAG: MarR family transcriptional regulator [Erysipelotrichaceae bacterium]